MKKILLILFVFISIGLKAQFAVTFDTIDLLRGGQIYYINISGDTLFINGDTIAGVTTDNLQAIYDTLGIHLDTLKAHNTRINTNLSNISTNTNNISVNAFDIVDLEDTNAIQRTNINALNPVTGFDFDNQSTVKVTYADGTIQYYSIGHGHPELMETSYGQINMTASATTDLAIIGTDYLLNGTFDASCDCSDFTQNANGTLTYTGDERRFMLVGTSDLSSDKAAKVTYTLYMDATPDGNTPHDFGTPGKAENISITGIITLTNGTILSVKAKSDVTNTTITVLSLNLIFVKI